MFALSPISFILILTGVLLNALAQLLLKAGTRAIGHFDFVWANTLPIARQVALQPYILGGLSCYVISVIIWIMALSRTPVTVAYPLLSIGYVVNAFAAAAFFGETLSVNRCLGIGFILVGVYFVAKS